MHPSRPSFVRATPLLQLIAPLYFAAGLAALTPSHAPAKLTIDTAKILHPVSPTLYGLMTEEINHAFDGGLYAELIQNRTFRGDWRGIEPWQLVRDGDANAAMTVDESTGPSTALPSSLRLDIAAAAPGSAAGVENPGFWGIALRPNTTYHGSFYAKGSAGIGAVTAALVDDKTGTVLAHAVVPLNPAPWSRYEYTLTTGDIAPSSANHLRLTVERPGTLWLQLASLMPPTYHATPNGNRPDLMERMAGLHPTFLRLPGGNYLEGDTFKDWYDWKKTIGPLVDRPGHQAPWTYYSTDGLGLLEFFEWCEDLRIEPVLAVYAGYALDGQHIAPGKDLEPYVQSALDEVEYATGDATTKWGAERVKDGHPAPFPLYYIEIGNEDFFDRSGSYDARFAQFASALRKAYPQYKLIATTRVKESTPDTQPDVIDDHYYKQPADMMDFVHHYDDAPRTGPKIFIGEWASFAGSPTPNFGSALSDAAWMTSLERNSDLIVMSAYAPMLVNVNPGAMQWAPDLIGYDAGQSYVSPSYHAQALFAAHLGDVVPQSSLTGSQERFFYSATLDSKTGILHLKLVNASSAAQPLAIDLDAPATAPATVFTLQAGSGTATNSITKPDEVAPSQSRAVIAGKTWQWTVPSYAIQVVDIPVR
jgi:alpha-N-arabinofuranosidase